MQRCERVPAANRSRYYSSQQFRLHLPTVQQVVVALHAANWLQPKSILPGHCYRSLFL